MLDARSTVDSLELETLHPLYLLPSYTEGGVLSAPGFHEVQYLVLCLCGVEVQVIVGAPLRQMLNFLPVGCVVVVRYQSYYGGDQQI